MPTPTWLAFLPHNIVCLGLSDFFPSPFPISFFWVVFFNEIVYISQVMKRNLSSFDIYVIVSELQNLIDGYVDKIYQLSRNEFLFRFKKKDKYQVYVRNGELLCITDKKFETPTRPSTFCMTLRKYLQNGRITGVSQHEFDRIIKIDIGKKEGAYTLVFEFFSDGNIVLVDPDGNIVVPLIRQSWAHRKLKGRESYMPPPSQINPFDLSKDKLWELLKNSDSDLVRTLAVNVNLSGPIAEEICKRAGVDKKIKVDEIKNENVDKIYNALQGFLDMFQDKKYNPVIVKKDDTIFDILPFRFESYTDVIFEETPSLTQGLSFFIETKKTEIKKDNKTDETLGKLNRQLKQQQEAIQKLRKQIDVKKNEGDLIYLHFQEIEKLLNEIKNVLDLKEKDEAIQKINMIDFVKKFNPLNNILIVSLKDAQNKVFDVKLNFRTSVSENAEKAYADNKKLRGKLHGAERSVKKTLEQIKSVKKQKKIEIEKQEKKKVKPEKKSWFERFHWFISSDGNIVIGGKDAKSNELVVKKYLKEGDRYAHADVQGASSIVIKSKDVKDEEIPISDQTLEEACVFAASFSKAWKQFAEAQAYWVLPEQVSKTAESGEFIPKGAFIIRGKRNYKRCKLELAIGEIVIDGEKKIMCSPISSIERHSQKYIILNPGDTKKNDMAKKLSKIFNVSVETVERVLPPGGITIIKNVGVNL
jgi:predicted ribosome quality control (RQC) complex YloA/Tae2 family protein